jgi:YD repeat-containing protein
MPFARSGSTITPAPDELGSLTQTSSGWLYVAGDNTRYEFNTSGRLVKQSEPYGLYHNLVYGSGGIVTVADSFGNSLSFTEDVHFQPRTLTAPGVSIAYNYDGPVRLLTAVKTTGSEVGTRTYHYENSTYSRFLTGITDERGIRFATFAYDSAGRAISSTHAGGADLTQVAYNTNGTVTVTNPLGKQATYHFTVINGVKRISQIVGVPSPNCPASNSTYTYDTRGLLVSQTDNKGNITEYAYNARGLRTSNIQAVGTSQQRVTTATWHPSLPLPMQITEPDRTVTYTRDALGRVLTRTISD